MKLVSQLFTVLAIFGLVNALPKSSLTGSAYASAEALAGDPRPAFILYGNIIVDWEV
ncbi:hypothetical protein BDV98DRAFT_113335 [Pterulicium gracile]|uniref:Uncharacterized protein n=1 Tax=Pterulicium gracile TaxID=1884261 RepID=A0A5C3QGI3_9AGAR|nr:hypothetical protein BDV98DRAFT_113335 [Pterula gracilis]